MRDGTENAVTVPAVSSPTAYSTRPDGCAATNDGDGVTATSSAAPKVPDLASSSTRQIPSPSPAGLPAPAAGYVPIHRDVRALVTRRS